MGTMSTKLLRKGSRGDEVRQLQENLDKLGFELKTDGIFGDGTEKAVIQLQTMFGYTVDGLVGEGTTKLIEAQMGYGWNAKAPDAAEKALAAQGKGKPAAKPAEVASAAPPKAESTSAAPQKTGSAGAAQKKVESAGAPPQKKG